MSCTSASRNAGSREIWRHVRPPSAQVRSEQFASYNELDATCLALLTSAMNFSLRTRARSDPCMRILSCVAGVEWRRGFQRVAASTTTWRWTHDTTMLNVTYLAHIERRVGTFLRTSNRSHIRKMRKSPSNAPLSRKRQSCSISKIHTFAMVST
jgi:hypothetical protein